jgi:predicted phosphoribosyltransferase
VAVPEYRDRREAGRRLAAALRPDWPDPVVIGLPRGGVVVAAEVATALGAPLDVIVVRKVGVPGHRELAAGAVAEGGHRVWNDDVVNQLSASAAELDALAATAEKEAVALGQRLRGTRPRISLDGRTAILVDDGLATGATMRVAVEAAQADGAERIVVAVPVGAPESVRELARRGADVICPEQPQWLRAVSLHYRAFDEVTTEEAAAILAAAPA